MLIKLLYWLLQLLPVGSSTNRKISLSSVTTKEQITINKLKRSSFQTKLYTNLAAQNV